MAAVLDYLQGRGVTFQVIPHAAASSAEEAATIIGVDPAEMANTVALIEGLDVSLAVIPASDVLDPGAIATAIGERARPADVDEIRHAFPGVEPGALPPLELLLHVPMYVDPALIERETIVFPAGRSTQAIRIRTEDLFRGDPIVVTPLTRRQPDQVVRVEETAEIVEP
jgi:prolyl-tRNA editing enzyme YbaK/EbsC (Cys-tRNA(Pro) deacylase)